MAIQFKSTKQKREYFRILCYGIYGSGKTLLCKTAPNPVILSIEQNLLCLEDQNIPFSDIHSAEEALEAVQFLSGEKDFETICVDSISELAEIELTRQFSLTTNKQKAYGEMGEDMNKLVRVFKKIPNKHLYFTCKQYRLVDEDTKKVSYMPLIPGRIFSDNVPYMFDVITCLRIGRKNDEDVRYLQIGADNQYVGKDSSGKLNRIERPDLTAILTKMRGE
jgi:hypothetical protein